MVLTNARPSVPMRVLRSVAYGCIGTAGVLLLVSPVFMSDATGLAIGMTWFLLVGGILSCLGAATVRWVGEFTGLPLLTVAFIVFGAITYRQNVEGAPYLAGANLALLSGIGLLFFARWVHVYSVFRAADRFSPGRRNGSE